MNKPNFDPAYAEDDPIMEYLDVFSEIYSEEPDGAYIELMQEAVTSYNEANNADYNQYDAFISWVSHNAIEK